MHETASEVILKQMVHRQHPEKHWYRNKSTVKNINIYWLLEEEDRTEKVSK